MNNLFQLPPPEIHKPGWPWSYGRNYEPAGMSDSALWPKISIITPSYNQKKWVEETIRSVLLQGYPNLEYFVIDGGSTDGSVEIIKKYGPWLSGWITKKDRGQSEAINKGLRMATGDIVAWINSDDYYLPGVFFKIAGFFSQHPSAGLIFGRAMNIDEFSCPMGLMKAGTYSFKNLLTQRMVIAQQAAFWKRKVYEAVGGVREDLHYAMDFEYWIRIGRKYPITQIRDTLACYRRTTQSKGGTATSKWGHEFMKILDEIYAAGLHDKRLTDIKDQAYAGAYLRGAIGYMTSYEVGKARQWIAAAFASDRSMFFYRDWWLCFLKIIWGKRFYTFSRSAKRWLREQFK
jgi:glycosyltransferase involved in cell wall biosynthesis